MAPERQSELDCSEASSRKKNRLCCVGNLIGLLRWHVVAKPETTVTSNKPSTPSDSGTIATTGAEHVMEQDDEIDVEQVSDHGMGYQGRPTIGKVWNLPIFFVNSAYTPPGQNLMRKLLKEDDKKRGV